MTGGFLADRFSKRSVTIGTKWMEARRDAFRAGGAGARESADGSRRAYFCSARRRAFSDRRSTVCCRNFCRRRTFPGATASSSWARFWPRSRPRWPAAFWRFIFAGSSNGPACILLGCTVDWAGDELRDHARACGESGAQVQSQSAGRSLGADSHDSRRPRPDLGRRGQHLSVVPGGAAAIHDRHLWARHSADRRPPHQLPAGGGGRGHRIREPGHRLSFRMARSNTG